METNAHNHAENTATITFSTILVKDSNGKSYCHIPRLERHMVKFSKPDSFEAKWILHGLIEKKNTAVDLIQLYSGDRIPQSTRETEGQENSSWTIVEAGKSIAHVTGVYDLNGRHNH